MALRCGLNTWSVHAVLEHPACTSRLYTRPCTLGLYTWPVHLVCTALHFDLMLRHTTPLVAHAIGEPENASLGIGREILTSEHSHFLTSDWINLFFLLRFPKPDRAFG
jgi:hypothetical protein